MPDFIFSNCAGSREHCSRRLFLQHAARTAVLAGLGALSSLFVVRRRQSTSDCMNPVIFNCRQCRSFQNCPLSQAVPRQAFGDKSNETSTF